MRACLCYTTPTINNFTGEEKAVFGPFWIWSRRRKYAKLTQEQRDFMERGMIYQYEALSNEQTRLLDATGLRPELPVYQQAGARTVTARDAILLNEKWRSELFGIPVRDLAEIRAYWIARDPAWQAAEIAKAQEYERQQIERERRRQERRFLRGE